jgi:hypothetical protein
VHSPKADEQLSSRKQAIGTFVAVKKCGGKRGVKRRLRSVCVVGCLIVLATVANVLAAPSASANFNPRKAIWGPALINGKSAFPTYKRLGVGIYSIAVDWGRVAPSRPADPRDPNDPAYRWPKNIVGWVTEARDNGIQVNIELTHAPAWANGGRFAVYSAVMKEMPSEQVILADQLLMDLMNKQPYLEAAQYQLMLSLALKST